MVTSNFHFGYQEHFLSSAFCGPGFDSWTRCLMLVELVVGSCPYSGRVFSSKKDGHTILYTEEILISVILFLSRAHKEGNKKA